MAMEINETEEYLGLLREKQAAVQMKLRQADEQIGLVHGALHSDGISELSSDDESDEIKHVTSEDVIPPFLSYLSDIDASDPEEYSTDSFTESHGRTLLQATLHPHLPVELKLYNWVSG